MKENIKNSFDCGSVFYDEYNDIQEKTGDELLKVIVNDIFLNHYQKKIKVLDLGCGTGEFSLKILENINVDSMTLVDLSQKMIEKSQKKIKSKVANFEIRDFDFYNNFRKFDLIVSNMALHWSENTETLLGRIVENINKKCKVLFSVPNNQSFGNLRKIFEEKDRKFIFNQFPESNKLLRFLKKKKCSFEINEITLKKKYNSPLDFLKEIKIIGANSKTNERKENIFFLRSFNKKEIIIDYKISLYLITKR